MKKWILALGVLSVLAACIPQQKTPPELEGDIPQKWQSLEEETEGGISRWWTEFNDDGLNRAIDTALEQNYDLRSMSARMESAAALAEIAGADLYPQISGNLSASRQKRNFVGFPFPGADDEVSGVTTSLFGLSLNLSWEIDFWGRIRAARSAAQSDFQASEADLSAFRLSLIGQTAKTWFAAVEAHQQVRLSEATVENYRLTNSQVNRRYRLGLRPSLDVRFSEANVANAIAVLTLRKYQLQNNKRRLEVILSRYPAGRIEMSESLPQIHDAVPSGIPADIVSRRPDLIAAENRLAAAYARVIESKRALFPRISLTGSGGTSSDALKNLLDGDYSVWNLVGNLLMPLFQGGRLRAGVDLSLAREAEALAHYAKKVLVAYSEVETALEAEKLLAEREKALLSAVEQSLAARDLAQGRYSRGLASLIEVLEAQRQAFSSQSQLLAIQRERLDNRIDLYMALGGGFSRFSHKDNPQGDTSDE